MSSDSVVKQRLKAKLESLKNHIPFHEWVTKYIYIKEKPFSFAGHEYLKKPYFEPAPSEVFMKAAQTGMSTYSLARTFYMADRQKLKALYFFPTDTDVKDFSDDRAKPMIKESPLLSAKIKGVDNKGLRQIGPSTIYFRGLETKRAAKSVNGDMIILDELDECNQENVQFARDRVLHSDLAHVIELSQPSHVGYGIHAAYEKSNQQSFLLRCPHCGHYNDVADGWDGDNKGKMPWCIGIIGKNKSKRVILACKKCRRELNTQAGEWVARFPDRRKVGYHMTQLISTIVPEGYESFIDMVHETWRDAHTSAERKRIVNSIVGKPYAGDNQPLTEETLKPAFGTHTMESSSFYSFMGVDVGDVCHATIGRPYRSGLIIIRVFSFTEWSELYRAMDQFNVAICVIDAMPYKKSAKDFARKFPGRVYIQYFKGSTLKKGVEGEADLAVPVVTTDRTESLDETTDWFKDGMLILPDRRQHPEVEVCIAHLKMLIKSYEFDKKGNKRLVYIGKVENHYGMAANSMRIASLLSTHQVYSTGTVPVMRNLNVTTH